MGVLGRARVWHPLPYWSLVGLFLLPLVGHLALGASLPAVMLAAIFVAMAALPIAVLGPRNAVAILVFIVAFRQLEAGLWLKLIDGQDFTTHLEQPVLSLIFSCVGLSGVLIAALVVHVAPAPPVVPNRLNDPRLLRVMTWFALALGCAGSFLLVRHVDAQSQSGAAGQGLTATLAPFIYLALCSAVAEAIVVSGGRIPVSRRMLVCCVACVLFGLISNSRASIVNAALAVLIAMYAFRYKFRATSLILAVCVAASLLFFVFPAILAVRGGGQQSAAERISASISSIEVTATGGAQALSRTGSPILGYFGRLDDSVRDRFAYIKHTDFVVARVHDNGPLGLRIISDGLKSGLPGFLAPDKVTDRSEASQIYCQLGDSTSCGPDKYATLPTIGEGAAVAGLAGSFLLPLLSYAAVFYVFKMLGYSIERRVLCAFMLASYADVLTEGSFSQIILTLRTIILQTLMVSGFAIFWGAATDRPSRRGQWSAAPYRQGSQEIER